MRLLDTVSYNQWDGMFLDKDDEPVALWEASQDYAQGRVPDKPGWWARSRRLMAGELAPYPTIMVEFDLEAGLCRN